LVFCGAPLSRLVDIVADRLISAGDLPLYRIGTVRNGGGQLASHQRSHRAAPLDRWAC
jgi:hypothetical protein